MSGDHYFSTDPTSEIVRRTISVRLAGRDVQVSTANGIFSPERIDIGTRVLLDAAPAPSPTGRLLDVGCGWGPLALTMAMESPEAKVLAVDVNERALECARQNAESLGLRNLDVQNVDQHVDDDMRFDTIWSNPPIRVGKDVLHDIMRRWLPKLAPGGDAWLVASKNLGGDSLQKWITAEFPDLTVSKHSSAKGFRVIRVSRPE